MGSSVGEYKTIHAGEKVTPAIPMGERQRAVWMTGEASDMSHPRTPAIPGAWVGGEGVRTGCVRGVRAPSSGKSERQRASGGLGC